MKRLAIAIVINRFNKHSFSVLLGVLENSSLNGEMDVIFLNDNDDKIEKLKSLTKQYLKTIIAYSFTTPNCIDVFNQIQIIKNVVSRKNNEIIFLAGGPHPSGSYEQTLNMGFDIAVVGEGEKTFINVISEIINSQTIKNIQGIAYRYNGKINFTGKSDRIKNLDDYPPFSVRYGLFGAIEISRGCPFKCKYCQTSFLMGDKMRHRSIDNILFWSEELKKRNMKDIRFISPNALAYGSDGKTINHDAIFSLLKKLNMLFKKQKIYFGSFPSEVRPEFVTKDSIELIADYTANKKIIIGGQSGSQRMLDISNRQHSVEDIMKAVEIINKVGLEAHVDFIFGLPQETINDKNQTLNLIKKLTSLGAVIHSHYFMPLAGTPWRNQIPSETGEDIAALVNQLTGQGLHYGQWNKQVKLAQNICKFNKTF